MTSDLDWRSLTGADIPAVVDLLDAGERMDTTHEHFDRLELAEEFAEDSLDLTKDSVAVLDGDRLVGMGLVRSRGIVRDTFIAELWGSVHPARRGEGIGRGILAMQLHRAAVLHAEAEPGVPARIVVRPYDHCGRHVELVRAAGLHPVRHWFDMQRDLTRPLPPTPPIAAHIEVRPYDPAYGDELRLAYNASFAESYGSVEQDPDSWGMWFTGSRAFRPELSTLALYEGRVVGFCLSYFYAADAAADGVSEGWIGQVGTLTGYRRHGIGTHLIVRALHAHRAAGYARSALDVDSDSDIGGLAIYGRLGFMVARKRTSYVRLLPAHTAP